MTQTARQPTPFGRALRQWRVLRRASQLELSTLAETTPRHLSFLETGRSRPSREMVLRLAAALDVPLAEQNALLATAGFDPAYPERDLDAAAMAPVRHVIARLLAAHEPYPALVMDRWYDVLDANDTGRALLLGGVTPDPDDPVSALDPMLGPWRQVLVNWRAVAASAAARGRRELAFAGHDERLAALLERLTAALPARIEPAPEDDVPVILLRMRFGATELSMLSTMVHFGGAADVTVEGLRIELFYPADPASESALAAVRAAAGR